jgi:CubicO group peptidase (beta-lactamase class C family)
MKLTSFSILLISLMAMPLAAESVAVSKPEDVGLSSERLQRITQMIQRRIDSGQLAGAVTLVARRGRIVHFEAQGLADLETKKPMAKESIFRIASMTKPITGVAIMMLVEEGKVRLTDPVSKYIPEFRGIKVAVPLPSRGPAAPATTPQFYTVPAEREIAIRDLLIHTSGLASGPMGNSELAKFSRKPNESLAEYIPRLGATPLEFQPGTRWQYSAFGAFDTLARIVEIASGRPFDRFLRERIFDPLEMQDIFFDPAGDKTPRLATVYQLRDGKLARSEFANRTRNRVNYSGGGGLMCTAGDYLHFGQMLANGGQLNGKRLLSPRTVDMMASPHVPDTLPRRPKGEGFGLSMRVVTNYLERVSPLSNGSYGWGGAHGTYFWVDPKEKIVAILMVQTSNREVVRDFEQAVMQAIVD